MRRYEAILRYLSCEPLMPSAEVIHMLKSGASIKLPVKVLLQNLKFCIVNKENGEMYTILHNYLAKILGNSVLQELEELT